MGRSTNDEFNRRIEKVADMLVKGKYRRDIILYVIESRWDVSEPQIDNYIKRAKGLLASEAEGYKELRGTEFGKSIRRLNTIFSKTMNVQDYARALAAQKEINSLLALYEPQVQRIDINSWQDRAVEDIRNGLIVYQDLEEAFDNDLATRLFARAGVTVSLPEITG